MKAIISKNEEGPDGKFKPVPICELTMEQHSIIPRPLTEEDDDRNAILDMLRSPATHGPGILEEMQKTDQRVTAESNPELWLRAMPYTFRADRFHSVKIVE
jgi:hypothetical protein